MNIIVKIIFYFSSEVELKNMNKEIKINTKRRLNKWN